MLVYKIPGRDTIEIENVVFDFNGTLAVDGKLIAGTKELLLQLKEYVDVYVLTADTYGTAVKECRPIGINTLTFPREKASQSKKEIVYQLGPSRTICVGNGFNDLEMCKIAGLSIAVIEGEGCSGLLLSHAHIVVRSIVEALEIILKPHRVKATLRS